jgi:hypothetical protein
MHTRLQFLLHLKIHPPTTHILCMGQILLLKIFISTSLQFGYSRINNNIMVEETIMAINTFTTMCIQ